MSTYKIQLIETDSSFLEAVSISIPDGEVNWYNIPFWYKKISKGVYEQYSFEDLPEYLKKEIRNLNTNKP